MEGSSELRLEGVKSLATDDRGVTVYVLPPEGQGLAALQTLTRLENHELKATGCASRMPGPALGCRLVPVAGEPYVVLVLEDHMSRSTPKTP